MYKRHILVGVIAALLIGAVIPPGTALAFDTGPHADLIHDALATEGFQDTAIQVMQVTNFMTDAYQQHDKFIGNDFTQAAIDAANVLHFDGMGGSATMQAEWNRLARATKNAASACASAGDIPGLLAVLGVSTHAVGDFYAHTNWVEPAGYPGYDGPGWAQQGIYGSYPTWFDIPAAALNTPNLYGSGVRQHGAWNADQNRNLMTAINKDWPGRPFYPEAYITAYFATRQWVQAVRTWINNETVWRAAQQYSDRHGWDLDIDLGGAVSLSFYAGHWQGQGEPSGGDAPGPGGSLDDLVSAWTQYRLDGKTVFRAKFEEVVPMLADRNPPALPVPVQPSTGMQASREFVALKVTRVEDATAWNEVGIDPGPDQADFYVKAKIAYQEFVSAMIHGYDTFSFPLPNYPFTFIKAVGKNTTFGEPVTTLRVAVKTCDALWAGTDDDVYLRVGDHRRFLLDKPLYDDFERGDNDTYSLDPPALFFVDDIDYLQIEKSPDGIAGGWKLCGVTLWVNGSRVYSVNGLNRWLEDDNRTWRAPGFSLSPRRTHDVPVTLQLYDSDGGLYGADDHCDINPDYGRYDINLLYNRSTGGFRGDLSGTNSGSSQGGSNYGGRGSDDDKAKISFTIQTNPHTPLDTNPHTPVSTPTPTPVPTCSKVGTKCPPACCGDAVCWYGKCVPSKTAKGILR